MELVDFKSREDTKTWYGIKMCWDTESWNLSIEDQTKRALILRDATRAFNAGYMGDQLFFDSAEQRDQFKTWVGVKFA